jgi:hypothetical protein
MGVSNGSGIVFSFVLSDQDHDIQLVEERHTVFRHGGISNLIEE